MFYGQVVNFAYLSGVKHVRDDLTLPPPVDNVIPEPRWNRVKIQSKLFIDYLP